jgi:hypothetical protein
VRWALRERLNADQCIGYRPPRVTLPVLCRGERSLEILWARAFAGVAEPYHFVSFVAYRVIIKITKGNL